MLLENLKAKTDEGFQKKVKMLPQLLWLELFSLDRSLWFRSVAKGSYIIILDLLRYPILALNPKKNEVTGDSLALTKLV